MFLLRCLTRYSKINRIFEFWTIRMMSDARNRIATHEELIRLLTILILLCGLPTFDILFLNEVGRLTLILLNERDKKFLLLESLSFVCVA